MTKKLFFDTNFWIRYFIQDDKEKYNTACRLVNLVEDGSFRPTTSTIVLLEIYYVLTKIYKANLSEVSEFFDLILSLRNIVVIDKTNLKKSLQWQKTLNLKLPDCLIASSLPPQSILITWDSDFKKIKEVKSFTPGEFLKKYQKLIDYHTKKPKI